MSTALSAKIMPLLLTRPITLAKALASTRAYGVELEFEGYTGGKLPLPEGWTVHNDNSLRQGVEIVSPPITITQLINIDLSKVFVTAQSAKLYTTKRCGLHVHVNVLNKTVGQTLSFIALYLLLEPAIFKNYAVGRDDSNFCIPLHNQLRLIMSMHNETQRIRMIKSVEHGERLFTTIGPLGKYSALNLRRLWDLGTLEMRQPYGSTDEDAVVRWVEFVDFLNKSSESFHDPLEITESYKQATVHSFLSRYFGPTYTTPEQRDQKRAFVAASLVAGHPIVRWQDLDWTVTEEIV